MIKELIAILLFIMVGIGIVSMINASDNQVNTTENQANTNNEPINHDTGVKLSDIQYDEEITVELENKEYIDGTYYVSLKGYNGLYEIDRFFYPDICPYETYKFYMSDNKIVKVLNIDNTPLRSY